MNQIEWSSNNTECTSGRKDIARYRNSITPCQFLASYELLKHLTANKRVLDIGCATGAYLTTFGEGSVGTDLSRDSLHACASRGLQVVAANFNDNLPFQDRSFDVVFCSHVLEHVDSPIAMIREMNRVLIPDGIAIIGLPTEGSIARAVGDSYFADHEGHLYGFSLNCIKRLLEKSGFATTNIVTDLNMVRRLKLFWLLRIVQHLPPSITMPFSNAFWVVAEKKVPSASERVTVDD